MTYAYHWRKAIVISICLHIFFIMGASHLMAALLVPLPRSVEVLLEMDLVTNPAEEWDNTLSSKELPAAAEVIKSTVAEMSPVMSARVEKQVSELAPAVTTSELAVTSVGSVDADLGSNQPIHSNNTSTTNHVSATSATGSGGQSGTSKPSILSKVDPIYPSAARLAGIQGVVTLQIEILVNGQPGGISVLRSSGHGELDEAAIMAVAKWRFVPAKDRSSGRSVACITTMPVTFRLHG